MLSHSSGRSPLEGLTRNERPGVFKSMRGACPLMRRGSSVSSARCSMPLYSGHHALEISLAASRSIAEQRPLLG
jgi:hypothetical protein